MHRTIIDLASIISAVVKNSIYTIQDYTRSAEKADNTEYEISCYKKASDSPFPTHVALYTELGARTARRNGAIAANSLVMALEEALAIFAKNIDTVAIYPDAKAANGSFQMAVRALAAIIEVSIAETDIEATLLALDAAKMRQEIAQNKADSYISLRDRSIATRGISVWDQTYNNAIDQGRSPSEADDQALSMSMLIGQEDELDQYQKQEVLDILADEVAKFENGMQSLHKAITSARKAKNFIETLDIFGNPAI